MNNNSGISFLKGIVFGVVAGTVAGVLLAPKAGEETREDLKKFAGEMSKKANEYYGKARIELEKKIKALKIAGEKIDEGKYKELIEEVVAELKNDGKVTNEIAQRMGDQLRGDWGIVKEAWVK